MATQTTAARKPRTRKPAEPETPVLAAWPRFDQDAWDALTKGYDDAKAKLGPVPRYHSQADKAELDAIDRDSGGEESDGKQAAAQQADEAHAAISRGRDVSDRYDGSAYEKTYRGEMTGCGDAPVLPFRRPRAAIPVQGTPPFGALDKDQKRRCDAVFGPENSAGPASAPDPDEAGPAVLEHGREHGPRQDDEALDKAPVMVITSDPLRVGHWNKPGSGDRGQP